MYVDKDSSSKLSIMEVSPEEADVLMAALIKLATSPFPFSTKRERDIAQKIAYDIARNNGESELLPIAEP